MSIIYHFVKLVYSNVNMVYNKYLLLSGVEMATFKWQTIIALILLQRTHIYKTLVFVDLNSKVVNVNSANVSR